MDAGEFSEWLAGMQAALRGEADSVVPCGDCNACCRSSQFVHIEPDEIDTIARIPKRLRFPAPLLPAGHWVMGFDEHGACPMLVDGACTIYEHRPRTCRVFDCRVFEAAGVDVDLDKPDIAERARQWHFRYATPESKSRHEAVRDTARSIRSSGATDPTRVAVQSVELVDRTSTADPGEHQVSDTTDQNR